MLGKIPDKAWKTLLTGKQGSDESFHQYVVRVCREVEVIHDVLDGAGYSREKPTEIVTDKKVGSCCLHSASVRLMTGVARVEGRTRKAKVRVFLDSGAEASFVTAALVSAINAEHVGAENVEVKPFGAEPTQQRMDKNAITIQGSSTSIPVCALVKPTLELDLKCASLQTIAQWHSWGVELSDKPQQETTDEIHMLIGAEYINAIQHSKKEVNGETVCNTEIDSVVSGPASAPSRNSQPVTVSCVTAHIDKLWQLDQPPERHQHLPFFPLCRYGAGFQVGLLW